MSLVAGLCLGASLDKPEQGGAAGEAAERNAGIDADAVKLLESEEIEEVAELTNSWLNQQSYPEKKTAYKPAKTNNTECGFIPDYYCSPTADDHIEKVDDKNVTTAEACYEKCLKHKNCTVFTYFKFRGFASCHLLRSCKEKKPRCTVTGTCVSGRKNCTETPKGQPTGVPCPKLKLTPGYNSHWRCEGVNPYKEDIPSQVTCHTSCPLWKNKAGKMVTAMSTCQFDGTWSETIPLPPGPLSQPKVLNKPDGPDMKCDGCKPLNLTYNPNMEKGAAFHCNPPIDWDNLPAKIDGTAHCNLLCDNMLVASMDCHNLKWTGRPELGFWCAEEQPPVNYWVESKENKYTTDKDMEKKTGKDTEKHFGKDPKQDTEKNADNETYGEDKNSKSSKTKYTKGKSMDYKMNLNEDMETEKDSDNEADTDKTSKIASATKTSRNKKKEQDILDYLENELEEDKNNKKKSGDLDKEEDIDADNSSKTSKTTKTAKKINKNIDKNSDKKKKQEQEILDEMDNELEDKNMENKIDEVKNSKTAQNSKTTKTKDKKIGMDKDMDMDMDKDVEEDKDTEKDNKMAKDTDNNNTPKTSKKIEKSEKKSNTVKSSKTTKNKDKKLGIAKDKDMDEEIVEDKDSTSKKALDSDKTLDDMDNELDEVIEEEKSMDKNKKKENHTEKNITSKTSKTKKTPKKISNNTDKMSNKKKKQEQDIFDELEDYNEFEEDKDTIWPKPSSTKSEKKTKKYTNKDMDIDTDNDMDMDLDMDTAESYSINLIHN